MRISINLASKPFVELRPLFAKLRLTMGVLALLAIGLAIGAHALDQRAKQATAQMDALKAQTAAFENERMRNEARMRQPQNKAVLDRSIFLNELFARKSFSWTATMMDLERVLPEGMQVTSIEPIITKEGDVNIRLRVSGDRERGIELIHNLEISQRFVNPRPAGESSLTADKAKAIGRVQNVSANGDQPLGNGTEFEIFSGYNPVIAPVKKTAPAAAPATVGTVRPKRKPSADKPGVVSPPKRPGTRSGGVQ